jgi:hypothetical protein
VLSAVTVPDISRDDLLAVLFAAVRPEFAGEIIRVDPDDPVFGRGRCGVAGCARTSWALQLCAAHHQRWAKHGKPAIEAFRATTGPVAERAGSEMVDAFDLSTLGIRPRLEVAYILQCRHDDRGVRVPPSTIRHLVGLLAGSGANSLLDRPLGIWLDAVSRPPSTRSNSSKPRTINSGNKSHGASVNSALTDSPERPSTTCPRRAEPAHKPLTAERSR